MIPFARRSLAIRTAARLRVLLALAALALPAMWLLPAAQAGAPPGERAVALGPSLDGPASASEMEAFLDQFFAEQLAEEHVAGAAVAVVKDGRLLFARGYGYADLDRRTPVVADQTIFGIGSTSKLFIWTAVMQLAEQGRLDLDADVNTYLDFQIPATYPQPITLRHLMSHTAGFEDRGGLFAHSPAELAPLGAYLAHNIPARVQPPGVVSAYSNYGAALAGYIVERVAGVPFEQYAEEQIFAPLEMRRTTLRQPVPEALAPALSTGYRYENGGFRAVPAAYLRAGPTGASHATATDMAHFMIAHLQGGRYGAARILEDDTAQLMQHRLFAHDPRVNGMAYGFAEVTLNQQRVLKHNGVYPGSFNSILALLPEHGVGIYASYNSNGVFSHGENLLRAFVDHYYPADAAAPAPIPEARQVAAQLAGSYRSTRMFETTFPKALALFPGNYADIRVTPGPDGIVLTEGLGPQPLRWVVVAPRVLRLAGGELDSYGDLVFGADERGEVTALYVQNNPYRAYARVPWYESARFATLLLAGCLAVFASAVIGWPIAALVRRRRPQARAADPAARMTWWLAGGAAALELAFLPGMLLTFEEAVNFGASPGLMAALALPVAAGALMLASLAAAARGWRSGRWGLVARAHYGLVLLATIGYTWWLHSWNLLGARI